MQDPNLQMSIFEDSISSDISCSSLTDDIHMYMYIFRGEDEGYLLIKPTEIDDYKPYYWS